MESGFYCAIIDDDLSYPWHCLSRRSFTSNVAVSADLNHLTNQGRKDASATAPFLDNITLWKLDHTHPYGVVGDSTLLEWWGWY